MTKTKIAKRRNKPGEGTVSPRKLASGKTVYDAWVTVIDPATMEPTRLARRNAGSTRAEAESWVRRQVADAEAGLKVVRARGLTVRGCWEVFKETTTLKETTVADCERTLNSINGDLWNVPITAINQLRFDSMIKKLRKEGVPTTRLFRLVEAWVHVFEGAIASQATRYNTAKESPWRMKLIRDMKNEKEVRDVEWVRSGKSKVPTPEQYEMLLATERRETIRNIFQLIGETAMRRGEALALEWRDIDLDGMTIWIRRGIADVGGKLIHLDTPKGGRARQILIDEETVKLLRRQRELIDKWKAHWGDRWEENDLVFPQMDIRSTNKYPPGHWMMPTNLSMTYHRRAKMLGFDSTKIHGLRYRWATMAFRAGVDVRLIQEHMGHRRLDETMFTYVQLSEEQKRAAVRMAGQAVRGKVVTPERQVPQALFSEDDDE